MSPGGGVSSSLMPEEMQVDKETKAIDGGFFDEYVADYEKVRQGSALQSSSYKIDSNIARVYTVVCTYI